MTSMLTFVSLATLLESEHPNISNKMCIRDRFQCSADTQMTLLKQLDAIIADIESRIGIDYKKGTLPNYQYTRLTLGLFVKKRYGTDDAVSYTHLVVTGTSFTGIASISLV